MPLSARFTAVRTVAKSMTASARHTLADEVVVERLLLREMCGYLLFGLNIFLVFLTLCGGKFSKTFKILTFKFLSVLGCFWGVTVPLLAVNEAVYGYWKLHISLPV
jgi:hypothetical protein